MSVGSFFSKSNPDILEDVIKSNVDKLRQRMRNDYFSDFGILNVGLSLNSESDEKRTAFLFQIYGLL